MSWPGAKLYFPSILAKLNRMLQLSKKRWIWWQTENWNPPVAFGCIQQTQQVRIQNMIEDECF